MEPDGMNVVMNIYRKQYLDFRYDYISRSEDILQSLCLYFFLFVCPCVQQETPRPLKIERRNKNQIIPNLSGKRPTSIDLDLKTQGQDQISTYLKK